MDLLPADWAILAVATVMAVTGLFRGFSGTLAFFLAVGFAVLVACFGWTYSAAFSSVVWQRAAGTLVATLLAFGLVRLLVKKLVGGLLSQPSDAIFGMLVGVAFGALAVIGWAYAGIHLEYSNLVQEVASYVR